MKTYTVPIYNINEVATFVKDFNTYEDAVDYCIRGCKLQSIDKIEEFEVLYSAMLSMATIETSCTI